MKLMMFSLLAGLLCVSVEAFASNMCESTARSHAEAASGQMVSLVGSYKRSVGDIEYEFETPNGATLYYNCRKGNTDAADANGCDCRPGVPFSN